MTAKEKQLRKTVSSYLRRKAQEQQNIIDKVPVYGKRYGVTVDELEEIEELLQLVEAA